MYFETFFIFTFQQRRDAVSTKISNSLKARLDGVASTLSTYKL